MLINELDKEITQSDLEALETFADRIFGKVGIDVEFTRHFLDRVNDERNGKQITASELTRLFKQEYKKWGKPIAQMGPDAEAVMKDLATDINMPFVLSWDSKNKELDLVAKTVMRKPNFKTSNREFPVESEGDHNRAYKVVHVKFDPVDIMAKTTHEAALKAAVKWGLKSTSGIDVHLYSKQVQEKNPHRELNEFTISDLKYMGITHITSEQKKELQKISHENGGNITRSDLKKVGLLLQTRHVREEELDEFWPAIGAVAAAGYGLYKGGKAIGKWLGKKRTATADMLPGDGLVKQAGVAVQNRKNQMNKNLAALKNEDAMSAEEIGKYPDLGWTNVNDTQEVKTYLNNMPHTPRVKIETFRQRVTEPHFQKFLKKYMTDHPDEPYDSVDSKPVTTNAPVKGHHNEDAVSDQVKGSDPMPKAKPGRTDHPYRGKLVGSKYDEEVVNEESGISRFNKEDPNNPEVMIQGYGSLLLNQIEDDLVRNFNSLEHMAKRKDWDNIDYQLNKTGVMQAKLEAIITTKEQLQSIRRKGGPKSRGITKESNTMSSRQTLNVQSKGGKERDNYTSYSSDYDSKKGLTTHSVAQQFDGSTTDRFIMPGGSGIATDKHGVEKKIQMKGPQSWAYDKPKVNASKKVKGVSLYDALMGEDKMGYEDESQFDKLSRKYQVVKHKKSYEHAAEALHTMLQRKYKENEGNWRHALGWYVVKIADGFTHVKSKVLHNYYLENYESAFIESVTETGGVGKIVQGVNTSIDVGPNEIKKQAAKFGNIVDKDGLPKKTFR